jgi:hypothetical protein
MNMFRRFVAKIQSVQRDGYRREADRVLCAIGAMQADRIAERLHDIKRIEEAEFQVFSQWGEDGIIEYLVSIVDCEDCKRFVEFGVQDYTESNTRFLLRRRNWTGLVFDGSPIYVKKIQQMQEYWRHELTAKCAFITRENINALLRENGFEGEIGLLSIDIDGNDYWVWEAITVIQPRIVVCEFNGLWGPEARVTIPYDKNFIRSAKHYSNLYYGASLGAFVHLAHAKGYALVGTNSTGVNAFFVRRDCLGPLAEVEVKGAFRFRKFREGRDPAGKLTGASISEQFQCLKGLPLYDVVSGETLRIAESFNVEFGR